jgi:hypothetical protein
MQVKRTVTAPLPTRQVKDPVGLDHLGKAVTVAVLPLELSREELVAALYGTTALTSAELAEMTPEDVAQQIIHNIVWTGMDTVHCTVQELVAKPRDRHARAFLAQCERRVCEAFGLAESPVIPWPRGRAARVLAEVA